MLLSIGPLSQTSSSSGMQMRKCRRDADGEEQLFAREIFFVPDFLYGSANISKILGPPNSDGDGQTENKASCESSMSALTGICTPARPFCCEQDTSIITTRINLAKIRSALSISFPTKQQFIHRTIEQRLSSASFVHFSGVYISHHPSSSSFDHQFNHVLVSRS